ncbi:DUF488 domain-containing protein [Acinetobacter silvestris]|uniref:MarR family transcriptional regulator n=1 Tax=Acinetobacter silvestris TaxID=1977882 RepID=A0A1Y3CCL8_9GAMM|nr:DUF488 family protein [Acinetobacter silvestris]OTG64797.1 MarR family transcriptional regulator [Acinetobacter silvestris]
MNIYMKRIYTAAAEKDGKRILVDRLWPRGIKKEDAKIDLWAKEITPSNALRKWYHEDMESRWDEFQQRYKMELAIHTSKVEELRTLAKLQDITLITAAKNEAHNHVIVLKQVLEADEI